MKAHQKIIISTSGWLYKDWDGIFYPSSVKSADKFAYFASKFSSVEINSTFYHVPRQSTVQNWYDSSPDNFIFSIKMHRYLTHTKRLVADVAFGDALDEFFDRLSLLRQKLGVVLVQLPPSLRADISRIEHLAQRVADYEKEYGMKFPLAVEYRHASWFSEEVYAVMRKYNIALIISDSPNRWPTSKAITADFTYIRFHGSQQLYRSSYTDAELSNWAAFIHQAATQCQTIFCYFNNDYNAVAIDNARTLLQKIHSLPMM